LDDAAAQHVQGHEYGAAQSEKLVAIKMELPVSEGSGHLRAVFRIRVGMDPHDKYGSGSGSSCEKDMAQLAKYVENRKYRVYSWFFNIGGGIGG
jgi:hypothetical protein